MSVNDRFRFPIQADGFRDRLPPDFDADRLVLAISERDRAVEDLLNELAWTLPRGELYAQQLTSGDVQVSTNAETTILTLGPQQYFAGRTYEIWGLAAVRASLTTSTQLVRIFNVTDGLRVDLVNQPAAVAGTPVNYSAVYRYQPTVDEIKEFALTFQCSNATGIVTVSGVAYGATGFPPAQISATDVGAQ